MCVRLLCICVYCWLVCLLSVSIGSVCYPFSVCVLLCVSTVCVLYVWRVSVVGLRVCACVYCVSIVSVSLMCACVTALVCIVSVYLLSVVPLVCSLCMCVACVLCVFFILCVSVCLFPCMYVYVSTVFYVYCICYVYVCFSVVCLCCWLPCWCGVYHGGVMGACFLGLVVLVFWGVWRVWNFFIFYSRFGVGGRLLLGFCYRTFFCRFPWGLCRARNFFKDITHSYCGYVIPVMSLYMCLLAYLYHTQYCVDTVPVLPFVLVPAFACVRIYLRLCHPCVSFCVAPVLCLLYCVSCAYLCLHYVLVCGGGLHSVPCACL